MFSGRYNKQIIFLFLVPYFLFSNFHFYFLSPIFYFPIVFAMITTIEIYATFYQMVSCVWTVREVVHSRGIERLTIVLLEINSRYRNFGGVSMRELLTCLLTSSCFVKHYDVGMGIWHFIRNKILIIPKSSLL